MLQLSYRRLPGLYDSSALVVWVVCNLCTTNDMAPHNAHLRSCRNVNDLRGNGLVNSSVVGDIGIVDVYDRAQCCY